MKKLTSQQRKMFWMFVNASVKDLKLTDWNIQKAVDEDMDADMLATCQPMWKFRKAVITLNGSWDVEANPTVLAQIALHEVMHILLAGVMHCGEQRWMTEKQHDDEEHEVIRRLIPVLTDAEEKE